MWIDHAFAAAVVQTAAADDSCFLRNDLIVEAIFRYLCKLFSMRFQDIPQIRQFILDPESFRKGRK